MAKCWERRDCDDKMRAECPHPTVFIDRCPTKCAFAKCDRATHELTTDPQLVFDATVDRDAAIKEECLYCGFFLRNGPRLKLDDQD
ncbi:MAG: hypothetical protein OEV43_09965 [Coriobacteriia bacterium]|nr:hypothetical protein [Coriobacteriia bacterium]